MLARFLIPFSHLLALLPLVLARPNQQVAPGEPDRVPTTQSEPTPVRSASPLAQTDWLTQVKQDIARAEYYWSAIPGGAYSAPNRTQELRSHIGANGIEVFPRAPSQSGEGAAWKLSLKTVGFGYQGNVRPIGDSRLVCSENRIERSVESLSEWYVNDERGIEQGWTIPSPPPGPVRGLLVIELCASGLEARVAEDGRSASFVDEAGVLRLRYQGLLAWDASGRELQSRLAVTPTGLAVEIEERGASYPITVDPVLSGSVWTAESDQVAANLGLSVSGAGDVNADGFDDVIVGAPYFDNGHTDEGRAFLYVGSAVAPYLIFSGWTAESDQSDTRFGWSVSGAGDVDGDGFDDVIVGAFQFDSGENDEGRAFLYVGSAVAPYLIFSGWTAEGNQEGASFGISVSGAGDVDGDGFDDVVVGASQYDNGESDEGRAFLYRGSAVAPYLIFSGWTAESDQANAGFGNSVSGAGDVDGDGLDDVIVGALVYDLTQGNDGRAYLYRGSAVAPYLLFSGWTADSGQVDARFGNSVSGAGDVNGDGLDDVIVGAFLFNNPEDNEGRAYLFLGSGPPTYLVDSGWTGESDQAHAWFGNSVSAAGDVNGDGFDDVIVGAPYFDKGQTDYGRAFMYLGLAGPPYLVASCWAMESDQANALFGWSVSGAGDVNGDGFDDAIVGAYLYDNGQDGEGRAFLYVGQPFCDCNGNGVDDADDIANGTSQDANGDGIPDECGIGRTYCTATPNSTGAPADITAFGSASSIAGNLAMTAAPVPNQFGVFINADIQTQTPFGNGFLCVTGDVVRGEVITPSGNVASYVYDNSNAKHSLAAYIGTTRNFQYVFRDPVAGGAKFNTSNAISIAILP